MEKAPQLPVTSGIVRGIHRLVVLTEELLMLSFGGTQPARTSQEAGTVGPDQAR